MAYFWLNQKEGSSYHDDIGNVYHYRGNTPGAKQLSEGDYFVYYRPGEYVLFGAGKIENIEKRENDPSNESGITTAYFAYIRDYRPFEPPLELRGSGQTDLKDQITFLRDKPGLTGVPQHSIHRISEKDYHQILNTADIDPESIG